jgi:hypothetical protein
MYMIANCAAETGRAAIEKLIYHDKVKFILGDPTVDAWLPITEENRQCQRLPLSRMC